MAKHLGAPALPVAEDVDWRDVAARMAGKVQALDAIICGNTSGVLRDQLCALTQKVLDIYVKAGGR